MRRAITTLCFAMGGLLSLPDVAFATHCDATFNTDIGPIMDQPNGTTQTVSEDCTGDNGCNDYFDIILAASDPLSLTLCGPNGTANFDTGLSVWSGPPGFTTQQSCNDDFCGLQSQLNFVAPAAGTYRVRIGGFGGSSGSYTLAYTAPSSSTIVVPNAPPDCSSAAADPDEIWPPDHQLIPIEIIGVTDPDGDPVSLIVDGVFQNEEVIGRGSGQTSPDASLSPLEVRAEREGGGSGRVYQIDFTADDGNGGACESTVNVCVPHDQESGNGCEGTLFDSTSP
jgi:hypothetical protein